LKSFDISTSSDRIAKNHPAYFNLQALNMQMLFQDNFHQQKL